MKKALIIIDCINDIIHPDGKLAAKWYGKYVYENNIIENINKKIAQFRWNWDEIIFVNVQFLKDYSDQPKNSPLFGKAHEFWVLQEGTWGTQVHENIDVLDEDLLMTKNRVSAFYGNALYEYLKQNEFIDLYFAGCSTDLAIESAVRDAHDRDFICHVCSDCCAASDSQTHKNSLQTLSKISQII